MRGRIPADEEVWLYHKSKTEIEVESLLQATLPPSPVEDEVDTYAVLGLAGRVSELSIEQKLLAKCGAYLTRHNIHHIHRFGLMLCALHGLGLILVCFGGFSRGG